MPKCQIGTFVFGMNFPGKIVFKLKPKAYILFFNHCNIDMNENYKINNFFEMLKLEICGKRFKFPTKQQWLSSTQLTCGYYFLERKKKEYDKDYYLVQNTIQSHNIAVLILM